MTAHEPDSMVWHKSSCSASNGNCVEIAWRKSSYTGDNGNCVEVGWPEQIGVAVRDSKHPTGPTLTFATPDWRAFLADSTHVSPAQDS